MRSPVSTPWWNGNPPRRPSYRSTRRRDPPSMRAFGGFVCRSDGHFCWSGGRLRYGKAPGGLRFSLGEQTEFDDPDGCLGAVGDPELGDDACTWVLTVERLTNSSREISRFVLPWASSPNTSISLSASDSAGIFGRTATPPSLFARNQPCLPVGLRDQAPEQLHG